MNLRRVVATFGVIATVTALGGFGVMQASATSHPEDNLLLNFTNQGDSFSALDNGPAGLSAGDAYFIRSHIVSGNATGGTAASCVWTALVNGGIRQCEIDFTLTDGIITTRGVTDTSGTPVQLAVTGGTGRYEGVSGEGTLTPTATGSVVELRVVR